MSRGAESTRAAPIAILATAIFILGRNSHPDDLAPPILAAISTSALAAMLTVDWLDPIGPACGFVIFELHR